MDTNKPIDVYFLLGATASGKSSVGLRLANMMEAEIVSVDSMQVYRGMDIGTAKPTSEELRQVPHHLINVVEAGESFSAAKFVELAGKAISEINERNKRVLAVGGTALYAKALAEGLFDGPGSNAQLRRELKDRATRLGPETLHNELAQVDTEAANRIHPNDLRRIVRALEVFELTGEPISSFQQQFGRANPAYNCHYVCLRRKREDLHGRINARVKEMIRAGLVDEVRGLLSGQGGLSMQARQALGYQEIIAHLSGKMDLEEAIEAIKINTRRFAKRQQTWFRRFPNVHWLDAEPEDKSEYLAGLASQAFEETE
ncbi:MAG: tRNA (adenosine(37)-N6)-dimethylallyltransferase MiaA [Actinobacteria bacterium]|nr:tRNA (adenosine(37)-N6)-dimethylallyltransferase MiaA [Actinomycetota bacterium]